MLSPYTRERIENWVGDFCAGDRLKSFAPGVQEYAADLLQRFFVHACAESDCEPEDLDASQLQHALVHELAGTKLPAEARAEIPRLCGAFLEDLEVQGRLANGRFLGQAVRAHHDEFVAAAGGKIKPIVGPATKLGRNDPCPCGSGKKYKKCCMNLLDS